MRKKTAAAAFGAAIVIVAISATPANAVDGFFSWDGEGANDNWSTAANWNDNILPGTADTLIFPIGSALATNNDLPAPYVVKALDINSAGFDLSGNAIVVNSQIGVYRDATIRTDLTASANQPWFVDGESTFTVTGDVDVANGATLDLQSSGDTVLDGDLDGPGTLLMSGEGTLFLNGGGNIPGLDVSAGGVHVGSVLPNTDVYLTGGVLSGGTPGNFGAQQAIAELDAVGGAVAPGPGAFGVGVGTLYLGGTFNGDANAALSIDIEGATSDSVLSAGVFNANNTQLRLIVGTAPTVGATFVIAESTDTTPNSFFTKVGGGALVDGAVVPAANGHFFRIDYRTTDIVLTYLGTVDPDAAALAPTGTDVSLPLVATGAFAVIGAALLFVSRRRTA